MIAFHGLPFVESANLKKLLRVIVWMLLASSSEGAGPDGAVGAVVLHCEKSKANAESAMSLSVFMI
jgi:hypothetical protein